MMNTEPIEVVEPEDRDIVEKLAKLQQMSLQIGGLRSLLPEKLINPARVALDNPAQYEPEKLAIYLQTAARAGSRDVEQFKKQWHSDDVRELWQTVNANELPQGGDGWNIEYGGLLQHTDTREQATTTANEPSRDFPPPPSGSELVKLVDDFRARHPELKIHVSDQANPLPIDVQIGQLDFRVEQSSDDTGYIVIGKPGTEASSLQHDIQQSISESEHRAKLTTLLVRILSSLRGTFVCTDDMVQEMIASYRDIKTRPCDKCRKLFDTKAFQLPLIRQPKPYQNDELPQFEALHRDCK
ncbi:hypothetical protein H2200_002129 [Cladophialophora chaetospira]|uniref:Uncharacterized protein n=1 Tax=Cladophialophora chaetospira TaxID=386627 RepID=A0AA38XIH9_9EURO|nr:hypothetical protein H2200_002129 [Cladophialophora chaetospira]